MVCKKKAKAPISYHCKDCNYKSTKKSHYERHLQTQKHISNAKLQKTGASIPKSYYCKICDFKCLYKDNYTKHLQTIKHINNINILTATLIECDCGKKFKHHSSYYRHKKKCVVTNQIIKYNNEEESLTSLVKVLIDQNKELNETIVEVCNKPKIVNNIKNTAQFNVINYLNTECKDAYNLEDYAKEYVVTMKHLEHIHNNGCVSAYADYFINDMKKLPHNKRPIHCTDVKRKSFQIKKDGVWIRDVGPDNENIVDVLKKITDSQCDMLKQWKNLNRDWLDVEPKQDFVNVTTRNIVDIYKDKIQKKIINHMTCFNPNPNP